MKPPLPFLKILFNPFTNSLFVSYPKSFLLKPTIKSPPPSVLANDAARAIKIRFLSGTIIFRPSLILVLSPFVSSDLSHSEIGIFITLMPLIPIARHIELTAFVSSLAAFCPQSKKIVVGQDPRGLDDLYTYYSPNSPLELTFSSTPQSG
jgi:hypothetical protein